MFEASGLITTFPRSSDLPSISHDPVRRHKPDLRGRKCLSLPHKGKSIRGPFVIWALKQTLWQFSLKPWQVSLVYSVPGVVLFGSNLLISPLLDRFPDSTSSVVTISFILSASSFVCNGPMFPVSNLVPASVSLSCVSGVLIGFSFCLQYMAALRHGMKDGSTSDTAFSVAYSAGVLTSYSIGFVFQAITVSTFLIDQKTEISLAWESAVQLCRRSVTRKRLPLCLLSNL